MAEEQSAYRYSLRREAGLLRGGHEGVFVMLNPSTADDERDDPTIRRCRSFALRENWRSLTVLNLFARRATDPRDLVAAYAAEGMAAIVGPENDRHFEPLRYCGGPVVVAWGAPPPKLRHIADDRVLRALQLLGGRPLWCLGMTKDGYPRHPLYVRGDAPLVPWSAAKAGAQPGEQARG